MKRFGALLQAIWPDAEHLEKPLVLLAFWSFSRSWRPLGSVLDASWRPLGCFGSCLEATAATDAAFDATEDASESSWIDLQLLRSALGATAAVLSL